MHNGLPNLDYIINAQNFQKIQDCLSEASDMAMLTVDYRGTPVTRHSRCSAYCTLVRSDPSLNELCRKCDARGGLEAARLAKPHIYRCHMDLLDFAVPIVVGGNYVGAILAGQVMLSDESGLSGLERIVDSRAAPLDTEFSRKLAAARRLMPAMTRDRVQVIANMMFQITNYIIEEAMLKITLSEGWQPPTAASSAGAVRESPPGNSHGAESVRRPFDNLILRPALEYIERNYAAGIALDDMAALCNISPSYFSKLFNKVTGDSFSNYINRVRVARACEILSDSDASVTVVAFDLGFEDSSYFNKVFKKITGMTPTSFRREKGGKTQR